MARFNALARIQSSSETTGSFPNVGSNRASCRRLLRSQAIREKTASDAPCVALKLLLLIELFGVGFYFGLFSRSSAMDKSHRLPFPLTSAHYESLGAYPDRAKSAAYFGQRDKETKSGLHPVPKTPS
jgi:hypothetical protein